MDVRSPSGSPRTLFANWKGAARTVEMADGKRGLDWWHIVLFCSHARRLLSVEHLPGVGCAAACKRRSKTTACAFARQVAKWLVQMRQELETGA